MMSKKALTLGYVFSMGAIVVLGFWLVLEYGAFFMYFLVIIPAGMFGWFSGRKDERELREEEENKK